MIKQFKIITGINIPDLDIGGIQTEYLINAPNQSDAKKEAELMFKVDFPELSKKYIVKTNCIENNIDTQQESVKNYLY